jgi:hypothetical protein
MADTDSVVRTRRTRRGAIGVFAAIAACIGCCAAPLIAGAGIGSVIACSALLLGAAIIGGVAVIGTAVFVGFHLRKRRPPESVPVEWRTTSP